MSKNLSYFVYFFILCLREILINRDCDFLIGILKNSPCFIIHKCTNWVDFLKREECQLSISLKFHSIFFLYQSVNSCFNSQFQIFDWFHHNGIYFSIQRAWQVDIERAVFRDPGSTGLFSLENQGLPRLPAMVRGDHRG